MDKTMDGWSGRLFYLGVAVILALGLLLAPAATAPPAGAAGVDSKWQKVATPNMDDWFVAPGFNAYDSAVDDADSVMYVVGDLWMDNGSNIGEVDTDELNHRLLKSLDGGASWKDISKNVDTCLGEDAEDFHISHVAVAPDNPDFVVVAAWTHTGSYERKVLYSYDGGKKFRDTGALINISSDVYPIPVDISVSPLHGDNVREVAFIGSSDQSENGNDAVVQRHRFEGERATGNWMDATSVTIPPTPKVYGWNSDAEITTSIAWSPNFARDDTVLVTTYNGTATCLQHGQWPASDEEDIYWNDQVSGLGINVGGTLVDQDTSADWPTVLWRYDAGIALPTDYNGLSKKSLCCLVWVNNGTGGTIYTVDENAKSSDPIKKQITGQPYLASLAYCDDMASGKAVAGVWGEDWDTTDDPTMGVQVYHNGDFSDMDTEKRWFPANDYKLPSGIGPAVVSYANAAGTKLYCLTPGIACWWYMWDDEEFFHFSEGALSVSFNDGESWNQIGLINTDIGYLTDVAVAPDCGTTILSSTPHGDDTFNGDYGYCSAVWLKCEALPEYASEYNGKWMRVWYGEWNGDIYWNGMLRLVPDETTEISHVYFVNDTYDDGTSSLFSTESKGLDDWAQDLKAPFNIVDIAVESTSAIYILSEDGRVAMYDGGRWLAAYKNIDTGLKEGRTIAVLGDSVLVGGTSGDVAYSADGGLTFTKLENGLPEEGDVFVAFDSYFDTNKVVYAAVSGDDIYRWTIGESSKWKKMHASDAGATYTGIVTERAGNPMTSATTGGVLYAAYCNYNESDYTTQSGVLRCLNPAEEVCCGAADWDNVYEGLSNNESFYVAPTSLKICGCISPDTNSKLFAIDQWFDPFRPYYNSTVLKDMNDALGTRVYDPNLGRLWKFEDCFAKAAPEMTAPDDGAVIASDPCNCWNDAFTLKWDRQCDACEYNVEISLDEDFTELVEPALLYTGQKWGTDASIKPPQGATPSLVILNRGLGDGSCGTTYYWRVRSATAETGQVIRSPWSEPLTFTIAAGPEASIKLISPSAGAIVPPKNVQFAWEAVPGATGYVFSLTNSLSGADVVAETSVVGTTYTYTGTLEYDTPYLWTVKAMKEGSVISQATSTFTTASAPVTPEAPATPAWVWVIIIIGAVLVIVTLVLIFRTRRV